MSREVRTASTPLNGTAAVGADRRVRPLYHEKWIGIFTRQVFIQGARQPGGPFQVLRRLFPGCLARYPSASLIPHRARLGREELGLGGSYF